MFDSMTALVVDDTNSVRDRIAAMLQKELGFANVIQESSASGALSTLENRREIDLIICDWEMPIISGFALLTQLKKNSLWKNIPFIMASSREDQESIAMARDAGVSEYLIKPFDQKILEETLSTLFNFSEIVDENTHPIHDYGIDKEVQINFKGSRYYGEYLDISLSGCQIKTCVFKSGGHIFDSANLSFQYESQKLVVKAKLVSIDGHRNGQDVKAKFTFQPMEHANRSRLIRFIEEFSHLGVEEEELWY